MDGIQLLSDARLFSMFRLYLSDTGGPVNELKFLAAAKRIHEKMQKKVNEREKKEREGKEEAGMDCQSPLSTGRIFI